MAASRMPSSWPAVAKACRASSSGIDQAQAKMPGSSASRAALSVRSRAPVGLLNVRGMDRLPMPSSLPPETVI